MIQRCGDWALGGWGDERGSHGFAALFVSGQLAQAVLLPGKRAVRVAATTRGLLEHMHGCLERVRAFYPGMVAASDAMSPRALGDDDTPHVAVIAMDIPSAPVSETEVRDNVMHVHA